LRFQDKPTLERTEQVAKEMLIELFKWNKSQLSFIHEADFFVENSYEETWIQAFNSIKKSLLKKKDEKQIALLLRLIESNRNKSPEHQTLLSKVDLTKPPPNKKNEWTTIESKKKKNK